MRLDDPNYRDATLSLLLASDIRGDKNTLAAARRAIDLLVRMRLTYPDRSASLWPIACTIEGSPLDSDFRFPAGADLIASQYAVQTLIAAAVMLDEDTYTRAIDDATKALSADRFDDGTWPRVNAVLVARARQHLGRNLAPSAGIIDSQSVKSAEKGGPRSIRMALTPAS
jgi:hypothetical protein